MQRSFMSFGMFINVFGFNVMRIHSISNAFSIVEGLNTLHHILKSYGKFKIIYSWNSLKFIIMVVEVGFLNWGKRIGWYRSKTFSNLRNSIRRSKLLILQLVNFFQSLF
jgi:hypothetical protein